MLCEKCRKGIMYDLPLCEKCRNDMFNPTLEGFFKENKIIQKVVTQKSFIY